MNIVRKDVDSCNAILTLTVEKQDYAEKVEKSLKDYRKKAQMPGFRPGNVPISLIKKMYGKSILAEEVNKVISDSLYKYIQENKLNILGEPLTNETEQKDIDFDNEENFEFVFDIGLAPEISTDINKKNRIKYYTIAVSDEMIDDHIKMHASRLGKYVTAEESAEESVIKGDLTEITKEGEPIKVVDALITPRYLKDDKKKESFIGKKVGDTIKFNPVKTIVNEQEVASLLNVAKENVGNYDHNFEYVIKDITNHESAEINQDLFDKVVGEGEVKNIDEFKAKIKEGLQQTFVADSDYRFSVDAREYFIKKNKDAIFPEEFLKRWVKTTNKEITEESLEKDFDKMIEYLKWDLIKKEFAQKYEIKLEEKDIKEAARQDVLLRFAQYGISNPQEEILNSYVEESLKQQGAYEQFYQQALEKAILSKIKEEVTLTEKEVTIDEFNKLFE